MFRILKWYFIVPHLHQGADHPFGFAVGLRSGDAGEFLFYIVLYAGQAKGMPRIAPVFHTVVRISAFNGIRTAIYNVVQQKLSRTGYGTIRQNGCIKFPGKVVNRNKQIIAWVGYFLVLQQRKAFGVEMYHFALIGLVVALCLLLELLFDCALDFGQALHAVFGLLEAVVDAFLRYQQLYSCGFQNAVMVTLLTI